MDKHSPSIQSEGLDSASLHEISEKLTIISEELKQINKEDPRDISVGKTCPYRRAILWTAFVAQIAGIVGLNCTSTSIDPGVRIFLLFLAFFGYVIISLAGETLVYRILTLKDSARADAALVHEKYNLTLDEMDAYIKKLLHIRLIATISLLIVACAVFLTRHYEMTLIIFVSYILTTFISIFYIRIRGKIKTPTRFFLFDMFRSDPGSPLMNKPREFFASDYDNHWNWYETSVLKRDRD